jgi:hypothetical protein
MKRIGALVVSLVVIVAVVHLSPAADARGGTIPFEAAKLIIEVNGTAKDAGLQFFLDSDEAWRSVEIASPDGQRLAAVEAKGSLQNFGLTELFSESNEPPFDELPLAEFESRFPEGDYPFSGTTVDGTHLEGSATLTHHIPRGPVVESPADGATVAPDDVVIQWRPAPQPPGVVVVAYQVIVEGDDPLRVFSVDLPADRTSLTVSPEYLEASSRYNVEVLAIEAGGNQTITESRFRTS